MSVGVSVPAAYSVLRFSTEGEDWTERLVVDYSEGSFDGLALRAHRSRLADLDVVTRLPGLRYLEVSGPVADDRAAFRVATLEELFLLTRCRKTLPASLPEGLRRMGFDDRPGKANLSGVPALSDLFIWSWRDSSLEFLSGWATGLRSLKVEASRGRRLSGAGLESCSTLAELELVSLRLDSLRPIARLDALERLWMIGAASLPGSGKVLQLSDLAGLPRLAEVRITFAGSVASAEPLLGIQALRDVRLRGTVIADGDLAPLQELRSRAVKVVGPDE